MIYESEQPSIYWLYVGAGMDAQIRVENQKPLRTVSSRDSLRYRSWNQEGRNNLFILFGGFSNIQVPEQDKVAMISQLQNLAVRYSDTSKSVLQEALPGNIDIVQSGTHLNRVSPLGQVYDFHSDHIDPGNAAAVV